MKISKRGLAAVVALAMLLASLPAFSAGGVSTTAVESPRFSFTLTSNNELEVEITGPAGADLYYTIADSKADGTPVSPAAPTKNSEKYTGPFSHDLEKGFTVRAIAYTSSGSKSAVSVAQKPAYLNPPKTAESNPALVKALVIRNSNNEVTAVRIVADLSAYKNLNGYKNPVVRYTLDGSRPTASSPEIPLTEPFLEIKAATVVNASVYCDNYNVGSETHTYRIKAEGWPDMLPKPSMTTASFYGGKNLVITLNEEDNPVSGAVIHYATRMTGSYANEDAYKAANKIYSGPVPLTTAGTHYVVAYADGADLAPSLRTLATVEVKKCSAPVISLENAQNGRKKVTITTTETVSEKHSPVIFYTLDGSTPTTAKGTLYKGEFLAGENCTIKAVVAREGSVTSSVTQKSVTASGGTIENLSVDITRVNAVNGTTSIYLENSVPGVKIYYELEKCSTTESAENTAKNIKIDNKSTLYTEPIVIDVKKNGAGYYALAVTSYYENVQGPVRRATTTVAETPLSSYLNTLSSGVRTVTFKPADGTEIYYNVNKGTDNATKNFPLDESHRYIYPLTISEPSSVSTVVLTDAGKKSEYVSFGVSITGSPKAEALPPVTISYASGGVKLDCADSEADIFYVLDNLPNTEATATSTRYARGSVINPGGRGYIHAVAMRPGYASSRVSGPTSPEEGTKTPTPAISVEGPSNNNVYTARFSGSGDGAVYYYTTNGAEPSEDSDTGASVTGLRKGQVVKVMAVAADKTPSDVAVKVIGVDSGSCDDVTIASEGSLLGIKANLSTFTTGAYIYYTTDGTEPSATNGILYNGDGVLISGEGETTLKAVATLPGFENSAVSSMTFHLTKLKNPVLRRSVNVFQVVSDSGEIDGVSFLYTLDGSAPNENSSLCEDGGQIAPEQLGFRSGTLSVMAVKKSNITDANGNVTEGYAPSNIVSKPFTIVQTPTPPRVAAVEYVLGGALVSLASATEGANIFYTLVPGGTPDTLYEGPIFVTDLGGFRAKAVKIGMEDSSIVQFSSASILKTSERPTASVESGLVDEGAQVELIGGKYVVPDPENPATKDYEIFYTTDGSEPTLESERYTGPITVNGEVVIKAAAAGLGSILSPTAVYHYYTEEPAAVIEPHLSRIGEDILGDVEVDASGLSSADGKAYIALYSGGEMLKAVSCDFAENMTFGDIDVKADGGLIIKLFVLDENLTPQCRAEMTVANI